MNKLLLMVLIFLISSLSFAGNRSGDFTFTPGGAYYHFSAKRTVKSASMPNITVDYNFNERWAVEGGVGLINTNLHGSNGAVHGFLYTADGLYRFKPYKNFEPYALAGVGILNLNNTGNNDPNTQGNINAGLGTQFFADDRIALRAEVRDLYSTSGGENDWMLNIGVSFLFDGKWKDSQKI
jgi:hypothetical protein